MSSSVDRVTEASHARNAQDRLGRISRMQSKLNSDVATGQTVHSASDNPLAVNRSMNYQVEQGKVTQYDKNAAVAETIAGFTSKSLESFNNVVMRAQELAARSSSELELDSYPVYVVEVNQLLEQAVDLGNEKHLGNALFAGSNSGIDPFSVTRDGSGKITAVSFSGNAEQPQIQISNNITISPYADSTTTANMSMIMNVLMALRNALEAGDSNAVQSLQSGLLVNASGQMGEAMADVGTVIGRIEFAKLRNEHDMFESERIISKEVSTNLPDTLIDLKQLNTAYEAATTVYGRMLGNLGLVEILRNRY